MKRIIASAGMVALGIAGLKAAPVATGPSDKPWSVSATLRGFYDDNYALAPNGTNKDDSFGFEVNPKVGVNLNGQQTSFGADYSYTMRYFDGRKPHVDNSHEFAAWLTQQFTERYSLDIRDNFVYSEEPSLVNGNTSVVRTDGTVLHNTGTIDFNAQITRLFGFVLGYRNELYDYKNPFYSAILDRLEHYANLDLTWTVTPQTVLITGYQFGDGDYTKKFDPTLSPFASKFKDFHAHYVYLGLTHNFNSQLSVSLKAGGRYTDYYNIKGTPPPGVHKSQLGPYVQASMHYAYLPGSYVEFGFTHDRTATDLFALDGESSLLYATLSHSFTPKLIGSLTGSAQVTDYDEINPAPGTPAHPTDWTYSVGVNLDYHFTANLSANVAYNYDKVDSDIEGRSYDRNRIFLGATVSY